MRVEVVREVATKMVNVYVAQESFGQGRAQVWTPWSDGPDWAEVMAGAQAPISLRVPEEIWVAMLAAGADVPMPSRAQHDHLIDAREVRDRLLALVEGGVKSSTGLRAPNA